MDENIVKTFSLASNVYKLERSYFTNNQKFFHRQNIHNEALLNIIACWKAVLSGDDENVKIARLRCMLLLQR